MKNDSTINENEKKSFEGVIIKDRETLRNILKKVGVETIEHFCREDVDMATNPIFGLKMVVMLSYMKSKIETEIMPRGIDE